MQVISRDYAYPSLRAPSPQRAEARSSAALRVAYDAKSRSAQLVWTLPYAVAIGRLAQVDTTLQTSVGEVPVVLRVLDGPRLELRFGSHQMPVDFEVFRVTVHAEGFEEVTLGGRSTPEGFAFTTTPSMGEELLSSHTLHVRLPTG